MHDITIVRVLGVNEERENKNIKGRCSMVTRIRNRKVRGSLGATEIAGKTRGKTMTRKCG